LYKKAKVIDDYIEQSYNPSRQHAISLYAVRDVVLKMFPAFKLKGSGMHKVVFEVKSEGYTLVFKIGRRQTIENDHRAYKRLPKSIRRHFFARIYWHTHYCLLQEHGEETFVSIEELNKLRALADKYGLTDIRCENVRRINGRLKIVDASIIEGPAPLVIRKIDSLRYGHPWLYKFVKYVFFIWSLLEKQK